MRNNLIAIIGFFIMSCAGIYLAFDSKFLVPLHILANAREAEARVTKTEDRVYARSREFAGTEVEYAFTVDGKDYAGSSPIDCRPSGTIVISYLRDDPSNNGAELRGHAWFDLFIFAVPVVVFVASGIALYVILFRRKRIPAGA